MQPPKDQTDLEAGRAAPDPRHPVTVIQARRFVRREASRLMPGALLLLAAQAAVWTLRWSDLARSTQYVMGAGVVAAMVAASLFGLAWGARQPHQGEEAIRAYRRAGMALVLGVLLLAGGLAGDYFVAVDTATGSLGLGVGAAGVIFVMTYGVWSGATP